MSNWLQRLTRRGSTPVVSAAPARSVTAENGIQPAPSFYTKLAVDAPGAPGRAGAEALYEKWAARWQEF